MNPPPVVRVEASPWYGPSPLTVTFDARESNDPSEEITAFAWDFGDGGTGSGRSIAHAYSALASTNYVATLTVIDDDGARDSAVATVSIYVPPDVAFDGPTAEFSMIAPVQIYASDALPDIPSLFLVTFDAAGSLCLPGDTGLTTFGASEMGSPRLRTARRPWSTPFLPLRRPRRSPSA